MVAMTNMPSMDSLIQTDRVHRTLYTDHAIFSEEMNKVFGGTWTFLAHESEVPKPNDFVRKKLGLRPIIVTRDRSGGFHALLNRCTHRGATVCRQDSGSARRFTCPYHNWSFENTGALVGVPMEDAYGADFDKSSLGLGRLRVEAYRGFIFGTLNAALPDLATHLGQAARRLDEWLDRWPGAKLVVRQGTHKLICSGNWKLVYDNSADGYHPGFSHASLLRMRKDRYGGGVDMQWVLGNVDNGLQTVADLGNGHTFLDQRKEINAILGPGGPDARRGELRAPHPRDGGRRQGGSRARRRGWIGDEPQHFPQPVSLSETNSRSLNLRASMRRISLWYGTSLEADDLPPAVNALRMRLQEDFPFLRRAGRSGEFRRVPSRPQHTRNGMGHGWTAFERRARNIRTPMGM